MSQCVVNEWFRFLKEPPSNICKSRFDVNRQKTTELHDKALSFGYYMDETYRGKSSQKHQNKNYCLASDLQLLVLAADLAVVHSKTKSTETQATSPL